MKKVLCVVIALVIIVISIKTLSNDYNDAVRSCVNGGNSYEYCVNSLK